MDRGGRSKKKTFSVALTRWMIEDKKVCEVVFLTLKKRTSLAPLAKHPFILKFVFAA